MQWAAARSGRAIQEGDGVDGRSIRAGVAGARIRESRTRDEALKLLAQMEELATKRYVGAWSFAIVRLALGEKEKAIDELERAFRERSDPFITFIKVSPLFDPLRGDPRFQALLAKAFSPGKK
jgi:hypothetical protein